MNDETAPLHTTAPDPMYAPPPPPPAPDLPPAASAPARPVRPGLRDRAFGLRALVGVALAGLVLGGAGGTVLCAVGDGGDGVGDRTGRGDLGGRFPGQFDREPGQRPAPPDGSGDGSGDTTSGSNT
jgi:hypothetical protein